ncbi:conserved hypothetical protein [Uncinocarpus reesii 1704]|uniref:Thiamine-binding protein domain-containing protein n=1 Tax=Uncinocarpus reesii (strain UAMH 1704) TaxID=336963 RepID=C4JQ42_UNCRE|nr:uncharacterized protein UREG_03275 [Uncinocarpus reesii 1704]EEP78429.1 conserved hypothetical protein [Uncinocarpus reesii 1704]
MFNWKSPKIIHQREQLGLVIRTAERLYKKGFRPRPYGRDIDEHFYRSDRFNDGPELSIPGGLGLGDTIGIINSFVVGASQSKKAAMQAHRDTKLWLKAVFSPTPSAQHANSRTSKTSTAYLLKSRQRFAIPKMTTNPGDYSSPDHCIADFCLIPIGTSSPSVSEAIADVERLVGNSGLKYLMHSCGTTVEGPWDMVFKLIGQAHSMLHKQGMVRVHTDIRVGSRVDKKETIEAKVKVVQDILARES